MLDVHDVYEYNVTRYDPETREGGLFAGYIDTYLKLKAGERLSRLGSKPCR
jgi:hypothetical protein